MEDVIVTQGLTKYFGGKKVVDRLDLRVPRGAIYALLGDNGAGKSTTIRMLTGLLEPDMGRASILGEDCWACAIELRQYIILAVQFPLYELVPEGLLRALHILKSP